jgi:peroxiredoxin
MAQTLSRDEPISRGERAPEFTLPGVHDGEIRTYTLSELTDGQALVLGVYVYDYSPVCTAQVCDIADYEWLTLRDDVQVVGVSGDGPYAHMEFAEDHEIGYPLLCDTAEKLCERYGVLHEGTRDGFSRVPKRSLFLISPDERVEFAWVADGNWHDWNPDPVAALNDRLDELDIGTGGD